MGASAGGSHNPVDPKTLIRDRALALGFDAVGFCHAELGAEARTRLAEFLAAGQHGDMGWLARRTEQRSHPQSLWPAARSVIALGLSYAPQDDPLATLALADRGSISVYARNRDYHDVVKGMLKHLATVHRVALRPRREGVRRHRAGDGKAAGGTRGYRLAGQAHKSCVARARFVAVPGRDLHHARPAARRTARATDAGAAHAASTSARPMRSPRPTGWMRLAASPT